MSVARDAESFAGEILRGDVSGLKPALVAALAGRIALRAQPQLRLDRATSAAGRRRLVLAGHAGALAALLAALRRAADPSVPARIAAVLGVDLSTWTRAPCAEAVSVAAAAAASDEADAVAWLQRAIVAAVARERHGGEALAEDIAAAAAAEDFQEFHAATLRTPVSRLLARPLWSPALRPVAQPDIERWQAQLEELGLHTLDDEYRRLVEGKVPDVDELNDALVAALDEAAPVPPEQRAGISAGSRARRPGRGRRSAHLRQGSAGDGGGPGTRSPEARSASRNGASDATAPDTIRVTMPGRGTVEIPGTFVSHEVMAPGQEPKTSQAGPLASAAPGEAHAGRAWPDLRPYAEALAVFLTRPDTTTPFMLAIGGAPGAGKSTLARMVRTQIDRAAAPGGQPHLTCWFDAWAHDGDALTRACLTAVTRTLTSQRPGRRSLSAREGWDAAGDTDTLHQQLGALVARATQAGRRLVLFLDELDRCVPPRPIELLEVVHHLLAHPNVVTVFTADVPALAASVALKYRDVVDWYARNAPDPASRASITDAYSRHHLSKLVHLRFDLPVPSPECLRTLGAPPRATG